MTAIMDFAAGPDYIHFVLKTSRMKNKSGLNYRQMILIALLTELMLIVIQVVYLKIYTIRNEGAEFAFTSEYMQTNGFYIFQIVGFFLYTVVVYSIAGKISTEVLKKLLTMVVAGGIIEVSFYLIMQANYQGAFLYSVLDKVIAAVFGFILFNYTTSKVKQPDSYL